MIGLIAFSLGGYEVAARLNMKVSAIITASLATSLCGGMIRDVILSRPLFALNSHYAVPIVAGTCLIAIYFGLAEKKQDLFSIPIVFWLDNLGLSSYTIIGTILAMEYKESFLTIIFCGVSTAIGGGVVRDLVLNQIPYAISSDTYIYVSLSASLMMYLIYRLDMLNDYTVVTVLIYGIFARYLTYRYIRL